jgi:hypothetical protein
MRRGAGRCFAGLLLGLFVLWQLLFLVGANFCEVTRHYLGPSTDLRETFPALGDEDSAVRRQLAKFEQVLTRWSELTNQAQGWSLFAPNVWRNIPFAGVELRWDEEPTIAGAAVSMLGMIAGSEPLPALAWCAMPAPRPPVYLLSDNEPPDVSHYFRVGLFRLRRFESNLDVSLYVQPDKSKEDMQDSWRQSIFEKVRSEANAIRAYLEWRWRKYQAAHPDVETPKQVVLHVRVYRIPPPPGGRPWMWDGPDDRPMARWRPHVRYPTGAPPVEVYDLVAERFDMLP